MPKIAKLVFSILMAVISSQALADSTQIDSDLEQCIEADSTTAGMVNCSYKAYSLWDKELNANYKHLIDVLPPSKKQQLRNSQKQWLVFRDAEFKTIDSVYSILDGTMYIPMRVSDRTQIVKARALQLSEYASLIDQQ